MPSITQQRLRELEQAERDLQERRAKDAVTWVGDDLGKAFALSLAAKPYAQWTAQERSLLRQVTAGALSARTIYIHLLPKE